MTQNSLGIPLILNTSHCITEGFTETFFFVKTECCQVKTFPYGMVPFAFLWLFPISLSLIYLFQFKSWGHVRTNTNSVPFPTLQINSLCSMCSKGDIGCLWRSINWNILQLYFVISCWFIWLGGKTRLHFHILDKENDSVHQLQSFLYSCCA